MTELVPSTDGVQVAVHEFGGSGPLLVVLHATGMHAHCYRKIADGLTDIRRVVGIDLRGHGDSETPELDLAWTGMVEDCSAVLDHLGVDEPVDFVGHSMGGCTVTGTELARPGSLRTAWLFEPIIWPAPISHQRNFMATAARARRATFDSFESVIERYASRPPFDAIDSEMLEDYVRFGFRETDEGVTLKCDPEDEAKVFSNVRGDIFAQLDKLTMPMTVVGSGDGRPPADIARQVAAALPNGTLSEWTDLTHFGPFENPDRAIAEIRDLITSAK